jgi:drug/metabolite transporter (DMT)-like permease
MRRWRAELALAGNTVVWGATFVLVKQALADVTPLLFLALRFSLAAIALASIFHRKAAVEIRQPGAARMGAVLAGGFLFCGYVFQTFGLRLTTAPKSAFITGLSIATVPLLAALVYRIRPRFAELAGISLAIVGLGLMTLEGESLAVGRGDLLTLACAIAFAAHIVTVGHYSKRVSFELLSVVQVAVAAALSLATFWWFEPPVIRWSAGVIVAVAVTALLATALAFTVQAWAQQYTTSTRTALIYALEPVFAWVTSFVWSGETLSRRAACGAGLILAGILLVELKPIRSETHPSK